VNAKVAPAPDIADSYERYQEWPPDVTDGVARYVLSAGGGAPRRCLILGCATGVNDVLPLARIAAPGDRIVAGDVEPAFLEKLRERAAGEGLRNIDARVVDLAADLELPGPFDLVSLLFVIHRLKAWEEAVDRLCRLVGPGGSFFISEFAGPEGVIYRSNEGGGVGTDPVTRLIRRYFELLPQRFEPPLRSTSIGPVLTRLATLLKPSGRREFVWLQSITSGEMLRRIADRAYAPYFTIPPPPELLRQLEKEFGAESGSRVSQKEVIRIYRFQRDA